MCVFVFCFVLFVFVLRFFFVFCFFNRPHDGVDAIRHVSLVRDRSTLPLKLLGHQAHKWCVVPWCMTATSSAVHPIAPRPLVLRSHANRKKSEAPAAYFVADIIALTIAGPIRKHTPHFV